MFQLSLESNQSLPAVPGKKRDLRLVNKFQKFILGTDNLTEKNRKIGTQKIQEEMEMPPKKSFEDQNFGKKEAVFDDFLMELFGNPNPESFENLPMDKSMLLLTAKKQMLSNYNLRGGASTGLKNMSSENQIDHFDQYQEEVPPINEVENIQIQDPVKVADIPSFKDLETSNFSRSNINIAERRKKLLD